MRKALLVVLFFMIVITIGILGFEYFRESSMLRKSGLELSRGEVSRIYSSSQSSRFGFKSRDVVGFELPLSFSGLSECGKSGFSEITQTSKPNGTGIEAGCARAMFSATGVSFEYYLFDRYLFVIVLA